MSHQSEDQAEDVGVSTPQLVKNKQPVDNTKSTGNNDKVCLILIGNTFTKYKLKYWWHLLNRLLII